MHQTRNRYPVVVWCLAILCVLCLFNGGCGGCRRDNPDSTADKKDNPDEKKDEKPKERFTTDPVVLYPGEFKDEIRRNRYKPGHMATASLRVTSNLADTNGQLQATGVNASGAPLPIIGTGMSLQSRRPVVLAREEPKNIETLVFLPHRDLIAANISVRLQLMAISGLPLIDTSQPVIALKPWQYHVVLLSDEPDQLKYLQMLDCVQIPAFDTEPPPPFYHLVRPAKDDPVPLSSTVMGWTTIAYLLWDGFDPERLDEAQRQALLDWLHFGGQIIVNGPGSLDSLQNSFLAPLLPAIQDGAKNISGDDLAELNANWSLPRGNSNSRSYTLEIPVNTPLLGVQLKLNPGARVVDGTAGTVVEKLVGLGRVVVTGFSLKDPRLKKWPSISSFFNGALLRKPPRKFSRGILDQVSFEWEPPISTFDTTIGSRMRMLSRDLNPGVARRTMVDEETEDMTSTRFMNMPRFGGMPALGDSFERKPDPANPEKSDLFDGQFGLPDSGLCGWNDEEGIAAAARETISSAAGIRPPSRKFVIQMLAGYLIVLVPLNWLFFRLIGKVEWAWIAAPIIAIAAAVTIIRMASLDIGFARSQTRVGLLEIHGGYSRAHLSEYSALYTSLSTGYSLEFDDSEGIAMPFRKRSPENDNGQLKPVNLERTIVSRMTGYPVKSNSTGMIHAEMFLDIGGTIQLETSVENRIRLVNGTDYKLVNAGIVRCDQNGKLEFAPVGELSAGDSADVVFEARANDKLYGYWNAFPEFSSFGNYIESVWNEATNNAESIQLSDAVALAPVDERDRPAVRDYLVRNLSNKSYQVEDELLVGKELFHSASLLFGTPENVEGTGVGELFDIVAGDLVLMPGQARLIGEIREPIGKHQLQPAATQNTQSTLVVVHLQSAELPVAKRDSNALQDFLAAPDQDKWMKQIQEYENEVDAESDSESDAEADMETGGGQ